MRTIANVIFSNDGDPFSCEGHQPRVLGRGGYFAINGHEDGAIIPEDDERRAISRAGLGASGANRFIETLRIGTC